MKIIYCSSSYIPSKTANSIHVMKMCSALADQGNDVILIAPKIKTKKKLNCYKYYGVNDNFKIKKIFYPNLFGKTIFYALFSSVYILKNMPDVVFGRNLKICFLATMIGINTIYEKHVPIFWDKRYEIALFKIMYKKRNFLKFIVISNALKEINGRYWKHSILKVNVLHDAASEIIRGIKKINLPGRVDMIKAGYFGHLYKGRGIEVLLSVAKIQKSIDFHIVGGEESDIKYWKKKISGHNNIFFHGYKLYPESEQMRINCDILLAPYQKKLEISGGGRSTSEFMSPLKIFEYMATQRAIVCSDLPVIREILDESCAMLVDPESEKAWIEALEKLKNKNLRKKLANNSYMRYEKKYSWQKRAEKILKLLR